METVDYLFWDQLVILYTHMALNVHKQHFLNLNVENELYDTPDYNECKHLEV